MKFSPSTFLEIRASGRQGLGVYAACQITSGTVIEEVPVLLLPREEMFHPGGTSKLASYVFVWDAHRVALALGFGSLYNHSYEPNARYEDRPPDSKRFIAIRDISRGEEITINYNGAPDQHDPVGFDVCVD